MFRPMPAFPVAGRDGSAWVRMKGGWRERGRCGISEGQIIVISGLFSILVVVATVGIIGRVLPGHWRARRWQFVLIDILLIVGSLLIASRPVISAARLTYRYLQGLQM